VTETARRASVAVVAVVVLFWLAVMERDYRLYVAGVNARAFARADTDLRAARLLNPDTGPKLIRAVRLCDVGRWHESLRLVEQVVTEEPENLYAWNALATVSRGHDPAAFQRAVAVAHRLDPHPARNP
jgi:hypothetical protein